MESFGKFCFMILSIIASALIGGYIFMKFWAWFIVPVFHLQYLSVIQSIGICFFIGYLRHSKITKDNGDFEDFIVTVMTNIAVSACLLGLGWIITLFM